MTEAVKVSTGKYSNQGKVNVDGKIWTVKLPGAGTDMRFSQASRICKSSEARLAILEKKIDSGDVTEEELDRYDEYSEKYRENEQIIYDIFGKVFTDSTDNNSEVTEWLENTQTIAIMLAFEEVKQAAKIKDSDAEEKDSQSS